MEQLRMKKTDGLRAGDSLPGGYSFVTHSDEYTGRWIELIDGSIGSGWTAEGFAKEMLNRDGISPCGIFYILHDNIKIIATATGVVGSGGTGTLHMVAIDESFRGRGLSAPLCARAINYLYDKNMSDIELTTDDFRIPAIKTYLKLGFIPVIRDEDTAKRWRDVAAKANIKKLPVTKGGIKNEKA